MNGIAGRKVKIGKVWWLTTRSQPFQFLGMDGSDQITSALNIGREQDILSISFVLVGIVVSNGTRSSYGRLIHHVSILCSGSIVEWYNNNWWR